MAILSAEGALLRANTAFRSIFRHWIGPGRPPWGRAQTPPFQGTERRFESSAPNGRRLEWVQKLLPDGASLAVARDVTERVSAAEAAARAKTTLFATLTHELRTPLNGVLGMAGLLSQTDLDPAQGAYVAAIRKSGEHLLEIITDILDYARLEAGRVELEHAPFDIEATMQGVAELLSPMAQAKNLEVVVLVRADAPRCVIGDDGRIRQILFNLAGNAVKFTESGGVIMELSRQGEGKIRLAVRDTGAGVSPDVQAKIFEAFSQADTSIARRHGGAGLGLTVVRTLARAMGGEAGLVSRPGEGASFWVDLPLPDAPLQAPLPRLDDVSIAIEGAAPFYRSALATALEAMGATALPEGHPADIVLLDNLSTQEDRMIEAARGRARAVIALLTPLERAAMARGRALGVSHYVVKPVRRASLVERVQLALSDRAGRASPAVEEDDPLAPGVLAGLRVLLAEDNPINALLARTLLARAGCVVDVVSDGEEAVAAAASTPYDLAFLDLRMPRLDGYEAARRIRALPAPASSLPLIALTAEAGEGERRAAAEAGMDDFVTKPINPARLGAVASRFTAPAKEATLRARA